MKKISLIISITLVIFTTYFIVLFLQNSMLKHSFINDYTPLENSYIINSSLHRCNYNIFHPKLVRVTEYKDLEERDISFYNLDNLFSLTNQEWAMSYSGGATVSNASYNEVLKLVKQDCSQFQKPKGNPQDETINWRYSPPRPSEYIYSSKDALKSFYRDQAEGSKEFKEVLNETYGNPNEMTEEEAEEIYDKLMREGIDEDIFLESLKRNKDALIAEFKRSLSEDINQKQRDKITNFYGEWKDLDRDDLYDYALRLSDDIYAERFSLD